MYRVYLRSENGKRINGPRAEYVNSKYFDSENRQNAYQSWLETNNNNLRESGANLYNIYEQNPRKNEGGNTMNNFEIMYFIKNEHWYSRHGTATSLEFIEEWIKRDFLAYKYDNAAVVFQGRVWEYAR